MLWDDVSDQQQHCDDDNDVHKPPAGTFALLKNKNIFALTAVAMVCDGVVWCAVQPYRWPNKTLAAPTIVQAYRAKDACAQVRSSLRDESRMRTYY